MQIEGREEELFEYFITSFTELYLRDFTSMKMFQFPTIPLFEIKYYTDDTGIIKSLSAINHDFDIDIDISRNTLPFPTSKFYIDMSVIIHPYRIDSTLKNHSALRAIYHPDNLTDDSKEKEKDDRIKKCWKFIMNELKA